MYLNSLPSIGVLPYLPTGAAVIAHAHELEVAYRTWRNPRDVELFASAPDRWIAASGAVRSLLVDEIGLPSERVLLHHEFIDAQAIAGRALGLREIDPRWLSAHLTAESFQTRR